MTAKEKADDLIKKYANINYDLDDIASHKEGALIAVEEIIGSWEFSTGRAVVSRIQNDKIVYWETVKKEIELK